MRSKKKNQFLENSWNASAIIQFRNRFRYPFENKYQTSEIRLNVTFICIVEFWRMIFYSYNISQLRPINVMSKYCVSGIKILDVSFACLPSFYVLRILSVFISYMAIYSRKSWNTLCRLPRTKFKANKTKFIDILKQPDEIQTFSLFCVCWLCKMNK